MTPEKQMELIEQFARLSEKLNAHLQQMNERLQHIDKSLEKIEHILLGNGNDGLIVRVDRLEQAENRRSKLLWVALTASIGTCITALYRLFIGG